MIYISQLIDNLKVLPRMIVLKIIVSGIYISQLVGNPEILPSMIVPKIIVSGDLYFPTCR